MEDLLRPLKRMRIHESEFFEFKTNEIYNSELKTNEILVAAKKGKRQHAQMDNYINHIIFPFKKIRIIKAKKSDKSDKSNKSNKRRCFHFEGEPLSKRNCGNSEHEISLEIREISDCNIINTLIAINHCNNIEYLNAPLETKLNDAIILIQRIVRGWIHRNRVRFLIFKFYI